MDIFSGILSGFAASFSLANLLYCFIGVLIGTLIGVLPGIGPVGTISLLLPATFHVEPVSAIIMLAGIYYGAMYGGSTTSILVNIPGEAASVVTCLDGYQMARKGRAGAALGISAFGSFIAGTLGVIGLMFMAVLLGALMIHGMIPGPMLLKDHPEIFWGTVTSMYMGNVLLLLLNLPLIGIWVKILKVPYRILFPLIILFCLIGAYSLNNSTFDVVVMLFFGLGGYLMRKFGYEGAPLLLAYVLGPMLEQALRQALLISYGSFTIFFSRPISAAALGIALFLIASYFFPFLRKRRLKVEEEAG